MNKTQAHIVKRRNRRNANGSFGLGTTTPAYAWDFVNNKARFNNINYGVLSNTPNWTFTRASTGYAQTSGGVLVPFASGELRRTDKGVLIEGAGTNLCLQSQTFDNASWGKVNATVTANAVAAPDGTTTADKLITGAAVSSCRVQQSFTLSATTTYTLSIYAKAAEWSWLQFRVAEDSAHSCWFDIGAGALGTSEASWTGATITPLANGWYRCTAKYTTVGTSYTMRIIATNGNGGSSTGDGTSGLYLWGAQLEAKAYASSYIPTTTASATRAADSLTVTGVTGLDYPLSLYAETDLVSLAGGSVSQSYVEIDDSSNSNRALLYGSNGSQGSRIYVATAGVQQALPSVGALATGVRKTAGRCSLNSFQVAGNGTLATEDTSGTVPATPNRILFGKENGTGTELFGYVRRAAIWTRALSDAELQAVTK